MSSEEEKKASLGMRATNDPSESQFATFTEALATGGRVGVDLASGIGQTWLNNDFGRAQDQLVTGRRSKAEHLGRGRQVRHGKLDSRCRNKKPIGLFHELPIELQDSLVITSKRKAPEP